MKANIWSVQEKTKNRKKRRKIFGLWRRKRAEKKREETICSVEEKTRIDGKGGNYLKREKYW